jgi:hypothetical protein
MQILDQLSSVIPQKYSGTIAILLIIAKWIPEFYSSVVNGGGIVKICMRFISGENLPKVVAKDYSAELNTKAPTPPTPAP